MNFKAMRYESATFNRTVPDKSHRVKLRLHNAIDDYAKDGGPGEV